MQELSQNLYVFFATCQVYLIRNGPEAVLVDFGDGAVLDHLEALGVQRVTDILMTHHHRDQGQGLARVASNGQSYPALRDTRIWAPYAEQDLFQAVDIHWQTRALLNHYDVRQDRFSVPPRLRPAGSPAGCGRAGRWPRDPTPAAGRRSQRPSGGCGPRRPGALRPSLRTAPGPVGRGGDLLDDVRGGSLEAAFGGAPRSHHLVRGPRPATATGRR